MQDFVKEAEQKMQKAIEVYKKNLAGIRTGRASAGLVDHITVEYYGAQVPIKQVASISVPEPRQIVIQAYDKSALQAIEKAILKSDLGINPKVESGLVRLILPQLTEDRRKDLIKIVKKEAEEAKIAVRNVRRDEMERLKAAKDKKEIAEDAEKTKEAELQKLTDKETAEIDKQLSLKEKEILEV